MILTSGAFGCIKTADDGKGDENKDLSTKKTQQFKEH